MNMNSGATAIRRQAVSAPTEWIVENQMVWGNVCHFGEGHAYMDTDAIRQMPQTDSVFAYDPNSEDDHKRTLPLGSPFDYIVSNYVLNVLEPDEREAALILMYRKANYSLITVRLDKVEGQPFEDGVITQRDTFQTQLKAEEWVLWFMETLNKYVIGSPRVRIIRKTRNYLMVEVS
jgi:hypothetical protein